MNKKFFTGVSTALITPFKNGEIDFKSLKKLIKYQLDNKIQGFVAIGSTAEAATLDFNEKNKLIDFITTEVAGQVPVIVGAGTNNTKESQDLVKKFNSKNIQGYLIVTPYYNKPPQRGLVQHFKNIAQATNKPVILYNVPSRTVTAIETKPTLIELQKIKNILGIKEASGDLKLISEIINKKFNNFSVLSGDDETYPDAFKNGADGVVSVVSHVIPSKMLNPLKYKREIMDVSKVMFIESNPIPVKYALYKMGIIAKNHLRLPLVPLDTKLHHKIDNVLKKYGVL